jgi:hypothetical protein
MSKLRRRLESLFRQKVIYITSQKIQRP